MRQNPISPAAIRTDLRSISDVISPIRQVLIIHATDDCANAVLAALIVCRSCNSLLVA